MQAQSVLQPAEVTLFYVDCIHDFSDERILMKFYEPDFSGET
jgi:hypothetical protein